MYNRYMNSGGFEEYFVPQPRAQPVMSQSTMQQPMAQQNMAQQNFRQQSMMQQNTRPQNMMQQNTMPQPQFPSLPPPAEAVSVTAEENQAPAAPKSKGGLTSSLKNLLGNNLKLPELDTDTILLIVVAYFLIADSDENMTDTLLIIGALFLLGL